MKKEKQLELVVEILDQDRDWGRSEFIRKTQEQGREVRVLSLGDSHPPIDDASGLWLDLAVHAEFANRAIQEHYPRFLYEVARNSGLLDITIMGGRSSLYWFMPVSEMSPLRNPLINKLYALLALKSALEDGCYERITLIDDDPLLEMSVRQIAAEAGVAHVECRNIPIGSHSHYRSGSALAWNWWRSFILDLMYWFFLNLPGGWGAPDPSDHILGLTIFPTLWDGNSTNRAFGDFPNELKKHGHGLFYLALPAMKLRELMFSLNHLRAASTGIRFTFAHSHVQLADLLGAYLRGNWGGEIARWHQNIKKQSFLFNGVDVSELLYREFLQEIWEPSIPQCLILVCAAQSIRKKMVSPACALLAFEFQPIEKAFVLGLKLVDPHLPVVGLQTSLIGQKHLGYCFLPEQVQKNNEVKPAFVPLPDYVATYGTVSHSMLKDLLGEERVALTGPVRYPYLKVDTDIERQAAEMDLKRVLGLRPDMVLVLLALTSLRRESETIMKWALKIGHDDPRVFFIIRLHYWANLEKQVRNYADRIGFNRFHINSGDLHQQLMACRFMVTGTSSIGVEAMVSGCMPVVYQAAGKYAIGPITDVRDGSFFFDNEKGLRFAVHESMRRGMEYQNRKARWSELLKRHCYRLDGKSGARMYNWLTKRGIFVL